MPINEQYRAAMEELRKLSKDEHGREIVVGLTYEETEEYLLLGDKDMARRLDDTAPRTTPEEDDRWEELHEKHETARRQVLLAENELRHHQGPKH